MIKPYWFQQSAINAVYDYFVANPRKGHPLVALPTGTGKSVVIALFIQSVLMAYPRQRIMMLTHVKELIAQNAERLRQAWPHAPVGIYSAGLNQRDMGHPIIFGGVASVYRKIAEFGHIDLLIIDEAHLLSPNDDGMYAQVIAGLTAINPRLRVIGLSATPWRMGQGMLTEGGLFTDVCFDMTNIEGFNRLVAEGFLAPLYPKRTRTEYDVSSVGMNNGDFVKGELEKSVDKLELTERVLQEMCDEGSTRDHWLVFASGIDHAEHIADLLNQKFGVTAAAVHSKIKASERTRILDEFRNGNIRCVVNNNVLTTGFDFAPIDLIGMMRPTMSPGLWVQMCGRGTRPSVATGKRDCIVLDFAGNTRRLGPINDPVKPRKKGAGGGDAPVRICEACGTYNPAAARICYACGHEFTFAEKLRQTASTEELIRSDAPIIETYPVHKVLYRRHLSTKNPNAKPCICVSYISGMRQFQEWVHLDAGGLAGHRGRDWWRERHNAEPPRPETCSPFPTATDAALSIISQLRAPKAIRVWVNRPNPEVQSVEY